MSAVTLELATPSDNPRPAPPDASELVIRGVDLQQTSDSETLRLGLRIHGREQELFFRFRGAPITPDPDAWAAMALPLAMRLGVPLRLEDSISLQTATSVRDLAAIYASWYPQSMHPVAVECRLRSPTRPSIAPGAACFFSGGVDSFYCVRKYEPELSHLIFVHGFDIPLANTTLRQRVSTMVRRCAAEMQLGLVEVETNLREVMDPYLTWGREHLSTAMAPIPLLLGDTIRRCYLPSDVSYAEPEPWGSHPFTTPLLSSPAVTMVHAGAEAERIERLRALADDPLARAHLRVCWQNVEGKYNCGRCHKCLHDMCALRALGRLDEFTTFPGQPDLDLVSQIDTWYSVPAWSFMLAEVQRRGTDLELQRALLALRRRSTLVRHLRALSRRLPTAPAQWGRRLYHRQRQVRPSA